MSKRKSKKVSKPVRKHRFLYGYQGDRECVYGLPWTTDIVLRTGDHQWATPMTEHQARQSVKSLLKHGDGMIYELIPRPDLMKPAARKAVKR